MIVGSGIAIPYLIIYVGAFIYLIFRNTDDS